MLQRFEISLLQFIRWYFTLPAWVGVISLGSITGLLVYLQFKRKKDSVFFGILATPFFLCLALHVFARDVVLRHLDLNLTQFNSPRPGQNPFPLLEPIFAFLIAPAQLRYLYEELFVIFSITYFALMLINAQKNYKADKKIFPDIEWSSVFGNIKQLISNERSRPERSKSNELGSGDFASNESIMEWVHNNPKKLDTALPIKDVRGRGGTFIKNAKLCIPREQRNKHMLIIAKTGSGKTTKLILPVLYNDCMDPIRSTVVLDSKPEMWRKLAAMTKHYNPDKEILLFNPLDTARSLSWNILAKIENDTDAKLIANTIIMATDQPGAKSDSPFFRNNALAILNAIFVGILHDPNERLSMPRVHELVQSGIKPLGDWLEQHPHAIRNVRTFVELARSGSQNADTIMSELSMRLSAWDLTAIRSTTYLEELDIETLVSKPTLLIVELRESELEMLRPMANVIVVEILRYLTKRAESCPGMTLPRPVSLVIDEFASALGRLPDIHVKLNTLRSRNVSIVAAIQSIAQVKANYADDSDSVLAGFSTKIFMPALDLTDSEWASKETGQMTIRFKTESTGNNKKIIEVFASKNDSTQEQVQQRAVLTPDEIGRPVDNISTFFMPNTQVFQGFLIPYYEFPDVAKRFKQFDSDELELKLRSAPIPYEEKLPTPGPAPAAASGGAGGPPPGISNTKGWTDEQIVQKLDETKKKLDWENTTGSAKKWWEAFENENKHRVALVLRLAEELANRKATITEFFLAYVYSNTDNIQANLSYLDYTRLKKEEERKKKEAAAKAAEAQAQQAGAAPPAAPPAAGAPAAATPAQAAAPQQPAQPGAAPSSNNQAAA